MAWYVVRTNIKCEDKAERNLRAAGFGTYAPYQRFERFNRRKRVMIKHETRLTPRYLFLEAPDDRVNWYAIRACEGVESVLGINGTPHPLSPAEVASLHAIQRAEAQHVFDETREGKLFRREIGKTKAATSRMKFPPGARVRINDGPFATFKGEVTNVNGRGHILVITEIFGRLTPVELDADQVEPLACVA